MERTAAEAAAIETDGLPTEDRITRDMLKVIAELHKRFKFVFVDAQDIRLWGGTARDWRTDRLATVIVPGSADVQPSFAPVAKHYGVAVRPCPPRRGNRKGVVEKANHVAAQRFWRTLADDVTVEQAQARLNGWCATRGDARRRATSDGWFTVAELAAFEVLAPMPTQFPALLTVDRVVSAQALVSFRGNRYSVPPNLHGTTVSVRSFPSPPE